MGLLNRGVLTPLLLLNFLTVAQAFSLDLGRLCAEDILAATHARAAQDGVRVHSHGPFDRPLGEYAHGQLYLVQFYYFYPYATKSENGLKISTDTKDYCVHAKPKRNFQVIPDAAYLGPTGVCMVKVEPDLSLCQAFQKK